MGGEEFVILLPDTGLESAARVAAQVRERVREGGIPHAASPLGEHVSVSIGVAGCTPHRGEERQTLLEKADRALYLAKSAGRDRVEIAATT
jgi:diguanylate cyclase (GGDEF)-like protein